MLYEFRSRATGTVTMVGKSAEQVLQIIGKPVKPTGDFRPGDRSRTGEGPRRNPDRRKR